MSSPDATESTGENSLPRTSEYSGKNCPSLKSFVSKPYIFYQRVPPPSSPTSQFVQSRAQLSWGRSACLEVRPRQERPRVSRQGQLWTNRCIRIMLWLSICLIAKLSNLPGMVDWWWCACGTSLILHFFCSNSQKKSKIGKWSNLTFFMHFSCTLFAPTRRNKSAGKMK